MKYIAYIVKGLENICSKELSSLTNLNILEKSSKHIIFEYNLESENLLKLKTIDDIGILLSDFTLEDFTNSNFSKILNINDVKANLIPFLSSFRSVLKSFSITLSIYKVNLKDKESLINDFTKYISESLGYEYTKLDHSNLDFRLNIEEEKCLLSLKLNSVSLFKRSYSHTSLPGGIRSTIASGMITVLLTKSSHNSKLKLVDSFCGSGTFLCEALSYDLDVNGGDINKEAVDITKQNLSKLGVIKSQVFNQNAIKTNFKDEYFDIAVSNFPWDKQIQIKNTSLLYDQSIKEYSRIVKKEGSLGFIGYKPELITKYIKKYFPTHKIEEIKIGYLGQTPSIVFAYK